MKKVVFYFLFLFLIMPGLPAQQLTSLPTLYITTESGARIADGVNWIPGKVIVESSDSSENLSATMTIRGRGNSTWRLAKKPYRIKLNQKTNFLNLPAHEKDWVLLANHADKTLIRNALAFKISSLLGFEFTPAVRFVDVVLNTNFIGNYMVTDQIERGKLRVDIDKLDSTDLEEPAVSGGYLVEIDGFATSEPVWFSSSKSVPVTVKYPDDKDITPEQFKYIRNFTNRFESRLFADDFTDPHTGYKSMVDTTSLINWYLASELTGNPDYLWSTYLYKRRAEDKFYFGPLWDFDIAFNNDHRLGDAVNLLMRNHAFNPRQWMNRFWEDEWFRNAAYLRWQELVDNGLQDSLVNYIQETTTLINASQQLNFNRWKVLNQRVYNEPFLFPTYQQGVEFLSAYVSQRIAFLTTSLAKTQTIHTALDEGITAESFAVYPNPVSDKLYIDNKGSEEKAISIYSMDGRLVFTSRVAASDRSIVDCKSLQLRSGIYLVKVGASVQKISVTNE
jgi:hypothetical protein